MKMQIGIVEENENVLAEYEKISIAFQVKTRLRVELLDQGLSGMRLIEEKTTPFIKDYDANAGEKPSDWARSFDLSNWGILSAFDKGERVGGAAVAWKTPAVNMLDGRDDLACLWDIRVAPDYRAAGVGRQLFTRAIVWARARKCRQIKIETQNINVPACRFYVRQGCELGAVNRFAYPKFMNEVQLIWYRNV